MANGNIPGNATLRTMDDDFPACVDDEGFGSLRQKESGGPVVDGPGATIPNLSKRLRFS